MGHESNPRERTEGDFEHSAMFPSVQTLQTDHLDDD